ncbi:hypothetical protein [Histidinibacterium aquaticum]|uniref:Uncharacterized protein n=1 Tax=Histidinibacterium aquaticum TaxID=2613962 RepID=A0A5J5GFB6_9RHOB|nr:hypothetical protein [Histidinibacterium aquaticum]KAA9006154.1 hypothetical protein F3S47_16555 [Histidinibacterium aquaticum]
MAEMTLTKTRLAGGFWEGVLTGAPMEPRLSVHWDERTLPDVEITPSDGVHLVRIPIPADVVSDGVQTVVVSNDETGERLTSFAVLAGEAVEEDIRAEVDLLRAELDMLKRAFRRHCSETA